jgi:alpha-N-arabinofuranosidase
MTSLKWRTPAPGPECVPEEGGVCITLPSREGGYDLWVESVADAPSLRKRAPAGDWDMSANVRLEQFAEDGSFHVGLMVGFAEGLVCIFGPYRDAPKLTRPELRLETTGIPALARRRVECSAVQLRVRKRDNTYTCFYRRPGAGKWTRAGDYHAAFPPKLVGVVARTFGSGAGVAFSVSDLAIETTAPKPVVAQIRVDARANLGTINRDIYGHFIEHIGRCINEGIWAEMLWNRKFTGGVDEQGVIESWRAFGECATFSRDNIDFYTSCQSQRIELAPGKEAGILKKDAHLGVKPGKYVVCAILKQQGLSGGVTVALRQGERVYASADIPEVSGTWTEYKVELAVAERDPDAQFSLSAAGPGTLWVGCLSLMPADNVEGMRRDVLDTIRKLKPPLIRWPGGNMVSGYHWEDGIGQRDKRMPRWERAWNAWEWNDFGTDEYIRFCRLVGTEPYICVNTGEAQADEAARWVDYCNGPADSHYGSLRAANGHPEPYRVKYWGIGNEMYGDWQLGHLDGTKYALKSIEFARAMKAVDPTIKLIGIGVNYDGYGAWNTAVVPIAGSYYDYHSVHYYRGPRRKDPRELTYLNLICASHEVEEMLAETADLVDRLAGRPLPLAFDEWNIWLPKGIEQSMYTLRDGLFAAGVFNVLHRLNDRVTMANLAQLVNVLGAIQTTVTDVVETPICKAFELYANLCRENRLETTCACGGFDTPAGRMRLLDASATISDDGKTLTLFVINRDPARDLPAKLAIEGFEARADVEVAVLTGPDVYTANTFESPDSVNITRGKSELGLGKPCVFPAHSVTAITLARKAAGRTR